MNISRSKTEVEEVPVVSDGLPPLPEWPVLMHVGRYSALRFVCPHDDRPMENESRIFSLKEGRYSCPEGHQWERTSGEWQGHRMPTWIEKVAS